MKNGTTLAAQRLAAGRHGNNFEPMDLAGQSFGRWTVRHRINGKMWMCRCECGMERSVRGFTLTSGGSKSCGCLPRCGDLVGQRFGMWLVTRLLDGKRWELRCDCGTVSSRSANQLRSGQSQHCGCQLAARIGAAAVKHGKIHSPEYSAWRSMLERCRLTTSKSYPRYGGRGIRVCERWTEFEAFFADMGEKPSPHHSIDRFPNNDGNYEPGNCRWATASEQARNKRNTILVVQNGVLRPLIDVAEECGLLVCTIQRRMKRGLSLADAIAAGRGVPKRRSVHAA